MKVLSILPRTGGRPRAVQSVALVAALLLVASASPARSIDVGPKAFPLTVAGVAVEIPVTGKLDAHTDASTLALEASATGDLQAIQDNALAIARGIRLPHDSCAHSGVNGRE